MSLPVFAAGIALWMPSTLPAQAISGDLVGTVQDTSGSGVPGASVEALNPATNLKSATKAGASGEYRFTNLPAGQYDVSASATGFSAASLKGVLVEVNKVATLNLALQVGQISTAVDVTDAAAVIDTTTATIGSSFDARESRDFPTSGIGLGALNLSLLNAGVGSNGGLNVGRGPTVGGQRPRNNNFTIEGVDNNYKSVTGALLVVPNDATEEFTLLQNQFSAEFGHSSGGQFNVIVKSGTNSLHGSLYEYFQNRNLNAIDQLFANSGTLTNPRFDQNRYGGTIGGPVIRNKLFFFGNYEYNTLGQSTTPGEVLAPTAKGYATLAGIPSLSPTNLAVLKQYVAPAATPVSNAAQFPIVGGVPIEAGQLSILAPNYQNNIDAVASADYNPSGSDQLRLRYIFNRIVTLDHQANLPVFFQIQPNNYHLATISEYHNFTPALTNELRLGFNRYDADTPPGNFKLPGLDSFPNIQIADLGGLQIGPDPAAPQSSSQNTYQLTDNVTWTKGAHTIQFGFDGRRAIAPTHFVQNARGNYQYSSLDRFLHDVAPDLFGQRTLGNSTYYGDNWASYAYANDTWRLRPNLTLNLGLRYEYTTVPFSDSLEALNSAQSVPGVLVFKAPDAQTKNFAPRLGLAWSPGKSGTTSIRVGFGMAYDVIFDNIGVNSLPPQFVTTVDISKSNAANFLAGGGVLPGTQTAARTVAQLKAATSGFIPDQKLPYSIQWNAGIQHVFAKDYTFEARYLATRGIHLNVQDRINNLAPVTPANSLPTYLQAPSQATLNALPLTLDQLGSEPNVLPAFAAAGFTNAALVEDSPIGNSTYHGLALQLNRRFSNGLQFIGSYTWSHLIDDSTADFATTLLTPRRPEDFQNLANDKSSSALDHRHRLTFAAVYDVPFFRKSNALVKNVVGNWSVAPIFTYESPEYITALSQTDSNLNGDPFADRTIVNPAGRDGVGSASDPLTNSAGQVVAYLAENPNARYIQAGPGAYANGGRNTLAGRPIDNIDLNLLKNFSIRERTKVQFSAQFFNLLNHAQFVPGFINRVDNPSVPNISGNVFNYQTPGNPIFNNPEAVFSSNPRNIQLALKILF
ncbi:MAG TPA: TonB-dependent receptor [Bryobacteraceae bacterium]|nr:TonB-dependent receptor [Bryobacteraceae bacterium]